VSTARTVWEATQGTEEQVSPPPSNTDQTTGLLERLGMQQENHGLSSERASEGTARNPGHQAQTGSSTACTQIPGGKAEESDVPGLRVEKGSAPSGNPQNSVSSSGLVSIISPLSTSRAMDIRSLFTW